VGELWPDFDSRFGGINVTVLKHHIVGVIQSILLSAITYILRSRDTNDILPQCLNISTGWSKNGTKFMAP